MSARINEVLVESSSFSMRWSVLSSRVFASCIISNPKVEKDSIRLRGRQVYETGATSQ